MLASRSKIAEKLICRNWIWQARLFSADVTGNTFVRTEPSNRPGIPWTKSGEARDEFNYDRQFVEKEHFEYGWGPDQTKPPHLFYPEGNPNEGPPDVTDLTTLGSFSHGARNATYKAALQLGVHWGKEKKYWHTSMGQYLKGVVNGRHVFDLTITIAQIRKMVRLMQSLVQDRCKILFVCNSKNEDLNTLMKIMALRVGMPYLDTEWVPYSLCNWDENARIFRGKGNGQNAQRPINRKQHDESVFFRRMDAPPDFVFFANVKDNQKMIYELNYHKIPMAAICDSDVKTLFLQYVIPCNTSSIQSVHFVMDMLTRGILEAQHHMEKDSWRKKAAALDQEEEKREKVAQYLKASNIDYYQARRSNVESPYDSDGFEREEETYIDAEDDNTYINNVPQHDQQLKNLIMEPDIQRVFRIGRFAPGYGWRGQPWWSHSRQSNRGEQEEAQFKKAHSGLKAVEDKVPKVDSFQARLQQKMIDEKQSARALKEGQNWPAKGTNWNDFAFETLERHAREKMQAKAKEDKEIQEAKEESLQIEEQKYRREVEEILTTSWSPADIVGKLAKPSKIVEPPTSKNSETDSKSFDSSTPYMNPERNR